MVIIMWRFYINWFENLKVIAINHKYMYLNLDVASSSSSSGMEAIPNQHDNEQRELGFEPGLSRQLRDIGC